MPRELPGFYFDAEKNRYFPASSKQAGKSHPPHSEPPAARHGPHTSDAASPSSSTPPPQNARRRRPTDVWHALQLSRLATDPRQRIATHQLRRYSSNLLPYFLVTARMCQPDDDGSARGLSGISGYSFHHVHRQDPHSVCRTLQKLLRNLHDPDIHNIQAGSYDGRTWSIAGDNYGVLHTFDPSSPEDLLSTPGHVLQHSWNREYCLDSQVSYVNEYFPNKVKLLPFIVSVTDRSLPFVPQAPDGCEYLTF